MRQRRSTPHAAATLAAAGLALGAAPALGQLRVAQWNITDFKVQSATTRGAAFQTSIYGVSPANGLSMAPDVMILEEINQSSSSGNSQAAVNAFVTLLNTAPGSPGDWTSAPYVRNQGDTGNALVYRTSKVVWLDTITLGTTTGPSPDVGSGPTQSPRDNQRWRIRPVGYAGAGAELYLYGAHMKAGATSTDQQRRIPEGLRIRSDANTLPPGAHFLLGGDFNVQSSSQTFYQYLTIYDPSQPIGDPRVIQAGQFFDPINRPGTWENQSSQRNIHTQEQGSQMDSRHDQILISASLRNGQGMSYLPAVPGGNILAPFKGLVNGDTTPWNDPNHSYRCWGNDGNNYGTTIVTNGNTQVGTTIGQALIATANQPTAVESNVMGGHLPVYLDLQVPAKLGAPTGTIDLGTVAQGATVTYALQVTNAADVPRFSKAGTGWGVDPLTYSLAVTPGSGFSIQGPTTNLERPATAPPAQANTHTIVLDTATTGARTATLTITSDDPDNPTRTITLTAVVGAGGPPPPPPGNYDVNADGVANAEDLYRWFSLFTDVNQDGTANTADLAALRAYLRWFETADISAGRR
jgi:endonuclease/exonuclease/phosphatase family metal-dependent hydrolase